MVLVQMDVYLQKKKKMNLDFYLIPYTNNFSKWTKDLNLRTKTTKLLEKNISVKFLEFQLHSGFFIYKMKRASNKQQQQQPQQNIN